MPEKRWFPTPKARQTLLNFQPKADSGSLQRKSTGSVMLTETPCSPRSGPKLPSEVWNEILRQCGTIALKKLRLVCREWSSIGAGWLFHTVYLNRYEKSWAGLISLSRSSHAAKVRSVEWNSLVLYNDCDDAGVWALRYKNLLRGLTHRDKLRSYDAYYQVYRTHERLFRSTSLDEAAEALQKLKHCHRVLVSDDYDLTSSCDDILSTAIANLPSVLNRASTWGLRPSCLPEEERIPLSLESNVLEDVSDVFKLLSQCSNVRTMTLVMWESHLYHLADPNSWLSGRLQSVNTMQNSHLTSLHCMLKTSDRAWTGRGDDEYLLLPADHEVTFHYFKSFSCLRDLRVEVVQCHPGDLYIGAKDTSELDSMSLEISSNASSCDSGSSEDFDENKGYDRPLIEHRPDGFTESMFACLCYPIQLTFSHFPSLRSLTLSSLSLNASSALCFLSSQLQLPEASFSLQFQGTVILYDMNPQVFFGCLRQLNVQIYYDSRSTYYYPPTSFKYDLLEWTPNLTCYTRDGYHILPHGDRYQSIPDRHRPGEDEVAIPHQMPPCPSMARQSATPEALLVQDRPSQFRLSAAYYTSLINNRPATAQAYRIRTLGHQTVWEWVPETEAFIPGTRRPQKDTYILHALLVERSYGDDDDGYGPYDWEDRMVFFFNSQSERTARESHYKQDLLQQYERELLGTDLLDLHKHQTDLAMERLRLSEASTMPDLEVHMLHQYETELLSLDLISRMLRETWNVESVPITLDRYPWKKVWHRKAGRNNANLAPRN